MARRKTALRALRQALLAVSGAAVFAVVLRVRGKGGMPPQDSGWREVTPPELR